MASYTETFPNAGTWGITGEDLSWTVHNNTGTAPISGGQVSLSTSAGDATGRCGSILAGTDHYAQVDWVSGSAVDQINLYVRNGTGGGANPDNDEKLFAQIFWDGSSTFIQCQDWLTNDFLISPTELTTTSAFATWRLEVEGDNVRIYRNGVLKASGTGANSKNPNGVRGGFAVYSGGTLPLPKLANFVTADLAVSPTGSQTPARTSDVPFLNANDRYQVVACVDQGTSTTTAEFRYWFSGAPEWDLSLNSDTQYPPFHTLDENSTYPPASVETPFKSIKTGQEDQIQGVYVEFVARPTALTEATVTSTYSVGFTARVEGISVPDWNRTVGTTVLTSGVVVSTNQVYETTAEVHDSTAWPNLRSAFLPCRLTGKVRAARVILTDVHLVAIRRIQLVGKLTPGRDA